TLAYVGDGNNVCTSLIELAAATGMKIHIACPEGYDPSSPGESLIFRNVHEAVQGAHIVYTDVWTSMGQEDETQRRLVDFSEFQVTDAVMKSASSDAIFMHCLPAHRGEEVSHSVMESSSSVVFDQAENRLHGQKAILTALMQGEH
ncbi:ornithine carbamoyltransferase, partial [bacterium]|nr:ornithine carbamoyltransferase [bacterium]